MRDAGTGLPEKRGFLSVSARKIEPLGRHGRDRRTKVRRTSHLPPKVCSQFRRRREKPPILWRFSALLWASMSLVACRFAPRFYTDSISGRVRAAQRLSQSRALVVLQASTLFAVSETRHKVLQGDSDLPRFSAPLFNDLQPNEVVRALRL